MPLPAPRDPHASPPPPGSHLPARVEPEEHALVAEDRELTVEEVKRRRDKIVQLMKEVMVEGQHYGKVPGTSGKPTLLQPGAELICNLFNYRPVFERQIIREMNPPYYEVISTCRLYHKGTGELIGEATGSCNSLEPRNRNKDPFGIANTILKIADKRSFVSVTKGSTAASDFFTVDVEDLAENERAEAERKKAAVAKRRPVDVKPTDPMTGPQADLIMGHLAELGRCEPDNRPQAGAAAKGFLAWFTGRDIKGSKEVTIAEADRADIFLEIALYTKQLGLLQTDDDLFGEFKQRHPAAAHPVDIPREALMAIRNEGKRRIAEAAPQTPPTPSPVNDESGDHENVGPTEPTPAAGGHAEESASEPPESSEEEQDPDRAF